MLIKKLLVIIPIFSLPFFVTEAYAEPIQVQILSAVIKDQRIPNATVILQKNGAQSVTKETDAQGGAELNTDFDDTEASLVIVKKQGYSNLVAKCPCKGMTYAISPIMKNLDGLRVVLNWGATPPDLDSHMVFPNSNIYFMQQKGVDANLDVDNTQGFGPETVTIEKKHQGETYVYAVHDYTNRYNSSSSGLSSSGAKVLVYIGQSLVRSYYVPKNIIGNLWTVFRITPEGEFQDINTVQDTKIEPEHVLDSVNTYMNTSTHVEASVITSASYGNAKALNKSGETAYHAGEIDKSIELYHQAIDLDQNYGQAYSNLGLAYQKAGRTAEAIWANRKAVALASGKTASTTRANSFFNIGKIYEDAGQFNDALAQYELAAGQKANPVYDKAIARMKEKTQ